MTEYIFTPSVPSIFIRSSGIYIIAGGFVEGYSSNYVENFSRFGKRNNSQLLSGK
jgi:hypothetical protein